MAQTNIRRILKKGGLGTRPYKQHMGVILKDAVCSKSPFGKGGFRGI